jgi:hypothetical protein
MTDGPQSLPNGVTLRDFMESLMEEREEKWKGILEERDRRYEEATKIRERARDVALALAEENVNTRLGAMNEFRGTVSDVLAQAIPRSEYGVQHKALQDALESHIRSEIDRNASLADRTDMKVKSIDERMNGFNKWLIGTMGGVAVAILLTAIDLVLRYAAG